MKRSIKILAVMVLVTISSYWIINYDYHNKIISQNIEAITTEETSLKEYQVVHFPCVNENGQNKGTYVGKCFKGGQFSFHQHDCSTCKSVTR